MEELSEYEEVVNSGEDTVQSLSSTAKRSEQGKNLLKFFVCLG